MPERSFFDYAILRVVPRVERGEFLNAGVVVFCRTRRFLDARVHLDAGRLAALWPAAPVSAIAEQIEWIPHLCAGGPMAGPLGALAQAERFHWMTAPHSTMIQTSPVHVGCCDDPHAALEELFARLVLPPAFGEHP